MSHDDNRSCSCVREHRPPYLELEEHHVWPLYLGGAKNGETIWLCGTTHTSIHEILRLLMKYGRISYEEVKELQDRPVARFAYNLALRGYDAWKGRRDEMH